MATKHFDISDSSLRAFCALHHIRSLALFGSILRKDCAPDSDVDVLVEFSPGERVGVNRLGIVEAELSDLLDRRVDLSESTSLNPRFRDRILAEAELVYGTA